MFTFGQKTITRALLCLLLAAVFDPADQIMHMKVPLFVAVWTLTAISYLMEKRSATVPLGLVFYLTCFSFLIPLSSIIVYMLRSGSLDRYDGFQYLKSYMFLTLCIPLILKKIDAVRLMSIILTAESIVIAAVYLSISINPLLIVPVSELGDVYGIIVISHRIYGEAVFNAVDFVTSPLLVIPISYFTFKCIASGGKARLSYAVLTIINVSGMFLSGTRINMLMSFGTLLLVLFWYSEKKLRLICVAIVLLTVVTFIKWDSIRGMLSVTEESNSIKLQHLRDYSVILSNPTTLLFGQGLGAFFNSTEYGYTSVTELTYMDMLRSYGILFATLLMFCLLYPLVCLTRRSRKAEHFLYLGYASYLVICITDPYLMSSSGMLVLSIVVAKTFSAPPDEQAAATLAEAQYAK